MTFRIGSTPVVVHPLTPVAFAAMLVLGDTALALSLLWSLAVHEYAHIAFARSFGYEINALRLTPFGGELRLVEKLEPRAELAISAAGPAASVILAAATALVADIFPALGGALAPFCATSLLLAVSNLIPAHPLDGGRMLTALLLCFFSESAVRRFMALTGFMLGAAALLGGSFLLMRGQFSQFLVLGPFLILSAQRERKTAFYALRRSERKKTAVKGGMGARLLAIPDDMYARDAIRLFAPGAYNVLAIVDGELHMLGQLGEAELLDGLIKLGAEATVGEIHSAGLSPAAKTILPRPNTS